MLKRDKFGKCFGNEKQITSKNNLKELYKNMLLYISKEVKDNQIDLNELRIKMGLPREEFYKYLKDGNYSAYEEMINEIRKMKAKKR